MDLTFRVERQQFNCRVGALILSGEKILAMKDEVSPYYYLPGGRVKLGEAAEAAILREIGEELAIQPEIVRPLWLNQSFFTEDVGGLRYHELCLYFLLDASGTDLSQWGPRFERTEGRHRHSFQWLDFTQLEDEYFYPLFLKKAIFHLPDSLTLLTTVES